MLEIWRTTPKPKPCKHRRTTVYGRLDKSGETWFLVWITECIACRKITHIKIDKSQLQFRNNP